MILHKHELPSVGRARLDASGGREVRGREELY